MHIVVALVLSYNSSLKLTCFARLKSAVFCQTYSVELPFALLGLRMLHLVGVARLNSSLSYSQ